MNNFRLDGLENFNNLDKLEHLLDGKFESFFSTFGVLAIFFGIIIIIISIILWVFSSLGLMKIAKKNNINAAWLAFFPIGRSYIIGKVGFQVYDKSNTHAETLMWVTFGLGIASFVLTSGSDLNKLINTALLVFESIAFYNMFKAINPKNTVLYTVFTVLSNTVLGGIFLYATKDISDSNYENNSNLKEEISDASIENKENTEVKNKKNNKETYNTETKNVKKEIFCSNCGVKLPINTKYCSECGNKVK